MKSLNLTSTLLRSCYVAFLAIAMVFASQTNVQAQDADAIKAEFQKALNALPDAGTTAKLSAKTRKAVNDARSIYTQGVNFDKMSSSQQEAFYSSFNSNHTAVTNLAAEPSCTGRCWNERNECLNDAGCTDTTWPCWCCIPCNLSWELCVIDCLVNIEIGVSLQGGATATPVNR